jgi:hypothetical protein
MTTDIIVSNSSLFEPLFVNQAFGNIDVSDKTRQDYLYRMDRFKAFVDIQRGMNRNTLLEYLLVTGKRSGPLFTSQSKRNFGQRLTTKTVWMVVRGFLDAHGISRNPHQFRSFFTTNLVKKMGNNLFDVIGYTRHRNIQTLQSYVNQVNKERTLPRFQKAFSDFVMT